MRHDQSIGHRRTPRLDRTSRASRLLQAARRPSGSELLHQAGERPGGADKYRTPFRRQPTTRGADASRGAGGAAIVTSYVDAKAFTQLFRRRHKNRPQICASLALIVKGVARCFWFRSEHEREDLTAGALMHAIERIDRFNFAVSRNAFAYYSSITYRRILRQLRQDGRVTDRACLFSEVVRYVVRAKEDADSPLDMAMPYRVAG